MSDTNLSKNTIPNKFSYISLFYNSRRPPKSVVIKSDKPSKTQISPLDCNSPQELLEKHGMYKDPTLYELHPEKLYLDLTTLGDYQSNLQSVIDCREKFMHLDPDIRNQFGNDIFKFIDYVQSKDFDITRLMNKNQKKSYKKYQDDLTRKSKYEEYLKSDKYKEDLRKQELFDKFKESQFNDWLKTNNHT